MSKTSYKVFWSDTAKADLKDIYDFIKQKSLSGAKNVISDIRKASKSLHFSKQTQVEPYFPICRRIIVRNYKILNTYDEANNVLNIVRIFDTRQNASAMER